jgi:hypothetical protein
MSVLRIKTYWALRANGDPKHLPVSSLVSIIGRVTVITHNPNKKEEIKTNPPLSI